MSGIQHKFTDLLSLRKKLLTLSQLLTHIKNPLKGARKFFLLFWKYIALKSQHRPVTVDIDWFRIVMLSVQI